MFDGSDVKQIHRRYAAHVHVRMEVGLVLMLDINTYHHNNVLYGCQLYEPTRTRFVGSNQSIALKHIYLIMWNSKKIRLHCCSESSNGM